MQSTAFDLASVTVTRVATSKNLREARVYVSIRDHEAERPRMLSELNHRRGELQRRISKDIVLKYTPRLTFELDTSVEEGDHVLAILAKLESATPAP
ncbi:MAG: 30S ribosome-binding factor RbfA [Lentisphaerae bacterium]|nr:30S ribosome-binding factor RbfA [Lentisphaerota bacterium]